MMQMSQQTRRVGRSGVLRVLRDHKAAFARRFGVIEMALYGSFARDEGGPGSDVDVLVRFDAPPDWKRYFGAQAYLERSSGSAGRHGHQSGTQGRDTSPRGA